MNASFLLIGLDELDELGQELHVFVPHPLLDLELRHKRHNNVIVVPCGIAAVARRSLIAVHGRTEVRHVRVLARPVARRAVFCPVVVSAVRSRGRGSQGGHLGVVGVHATPGSESDETRPTVPRQCIAHCSSGRLRSVDSVEEPRRARRNADAAWPWRWDPKRVDGRQKDNQPCYRRRRTTRHHRPHTLATSAISNGAFQRFAFIQKRSFSSRR
mmetsp:Transcript_18085/g.41544  ORF Transcript_18085/g.41544 Transcript_18085/m.41544 type:complete len:214 (+) Transcript_18085:322-963(+)